MMSISDYPRGRMPLRLADGLLKKLADSNNGAIECQDSTGVGSDNVDIKPVEY